MLNKLETQISKLLSIAKEREKSIEYSKKLIIAIRKLEKDYQLGKVSYSEYEKVKYYYLKGKPLEQVLNEFNQYIIQLSKQLQQLHSHIFYHVYNDESYKQLKIVVPFIQKPEKKLTKYGTAETVPTHDEMDHIVSKHKGKHLPAFSKKREEYVLQKKPIVITPYERDILIKRGLLKPEHPEEKPIHITDYERDILIRRGLIKPEHAGLQGKAAPITEYEREILIKRGLLKQGEQGPVTDIEPQEGVEVIVDKEVEEKFVPKEPQQLHAQVLKEEKEARKSLGLPQEKPIEVQAEQVVSEGKQRLVKPTKKAEKEAKQEFFKELYGKPKSKVSDKKHVDLLEQLFETKLEERTFIGEKTKIPRALIELETLKKKAEAAEIKFDYKRFVEQREKGVFAKLLKKEEPKEVTKKISPMVRIGAIANVTVRPIGNFFITKFPGFFENLYKGLRLANMPVLSNTYVNIIVLTVLLASGLFFIFFFLVFLFRGAPIFEVVLKSLLTAVLGGAASFTALYAYPFMKQDERAKAIRQNLPFAMNHMSAIASSGISPVQMFRLISQSGEEYGTVSEEMQKITNYVEIFGYDISTAVETVSATTASEELKSFLEGLITTINTGGDLGAYLKQKAEEALVAYRIEREKYIETISTYSDVYTGILIAAPLFFISILSLVSILGGTVLGFGVTVIMAFGTYVLIPLLNIGFIGFLQITKVKT